MIRTLDQIDIESVQATVLNNMHQFEEVNRGPFADDDFMPGTVRYVVPEGVQFEFHTECEDFDEDQEPVIAEAGSILMIYSEQMTADYDYNRVYAIQLQDGRQFSLSAT